MASNIMIIDVPKDVAQDQPQRAASTMLFNQAISVEFCQRMAREGWAMTLIDVTWNRYGFYRAPEAGTGASATK